MECDRFREALSARLDGEDLGVTASVLQRHLRGCAGCRQWERDLNNLRRAGRVGPAEPVPDLSARILAEIGQAQGLERRRQRARVVQLGLVLVAGLQLLLAAPDLLSTDGQGRAHTLHELGSFDLALAVGFLCVAWRPARAHGMLPLLAALAAGLGATALVDISEGHAVALTEGTHLLDLAGFALVWLLSRLRPDPHSDRRPPVWRHGPAPAA